jgi:hypothetical protein
MGQDGSRRGAGHADGDVSRDDVSVSVSGRSEPVGAGLAVDLDAQNDLG